MQEQKIIYDILGIGIGPFNLGLAALCNEIPELKCLFIEKKTEFSWHPGLLLNDVRMQVPFYADLVTLADPTNRFHYLCFLHNKQRMFRFGIREKFFIKRTHYNEYCQWVAEQLPSLKFNTICENIIYNKEQKTYTVKTQEETFYAKHIVLGIGTVPSLPSFVELTTERLTLHSADYLYRKEELLKQESITIVGSGQSAAEIFRDLLQCYNGEIYWFTRTNHLYPMDYTSFALEKATPDYIAHYFSLPGHMKDKVLRTQDSLFKGINKDTVATIYDLLDDKTNTEATKIHIHPACELKAIYANINLDFYHTELQQYFTHETKGVVLATGYKNADPNFLEKGLQPINENYSMGLDNNLFVQNAETESHGFNASDLSLGPHRNAKILNTILGKEHFKIETNITFQNFGLPNKSKNIHK